MLYLSVFGATNNRVKIRENAHTREGESGTSAVSFYCVGNGLKNVRRREKESTECDTKTLTTTHYTRHHQAAYYKTDAAD